MSDLNPLAQLVRGRQAFIRGDAISDLFSVVRPPHMVMAANLLNKAMRVLADDRPRAVGYVERAVRLPFDQVEQAAPAALEAHLALFVLITDTLENSEEGDTRWLDAAITVLDEADEPGRCELRDVLEAVDHDYNVSKVEREWLRGALIGIPDRPELRDLDLSADELRDHVLAILDTCAAYSEEVGLVAE